MPDASRGFRYLEIERGEGIEQLVLYFEAAKNAPPLTLLADRRSGDRHALIEVADGSLEMIGGRIRFENSKFVPLPRHMIAVRGGQLRLLHCALQGPMGQGPPSFRALIDFDCATSTAVPTLAVHESILASAKSLILVRGSKSRLRIKQSMLVAAGDCVHQRPGITHYLFDYSPDMEYLEVVSPADFKTVEVEGPCVVPPPTAWTKIA